MDDDPLRRKVAVKILKQEYAASPKVLQRTRDEARMMSRMQHPHIVRVERLIEANGLPALVMELVKGVSVKDLVKRYPRGLPAAVAMEIARHTCVALHAAYFEATDDQGQPLQIIHRDIKPSNLLLSIHGQLKVVDFGIAKGNFEERESRTESVVMGSRPYMAPERLDGGKDTSAVDIYSAGMSLFEMLSGHPMNLSINPASHDQSMGVQLQKLRLGGIPASAAEDLRQLIRRMCAYDVEYRPTAREATVELARLAESLPADQQVPLEAFAREVVRPLYQHRKVVPVKQALADLELEELVDGTRGGRAYRHRRRTLATMSRRPALFFGVLLGLISMLSLSALMKARQRDGSGEGGPAAQELLKVKVWFPSDAKAVIGTTLLSVPGHVELTRGAHTLYLDFEDKTELKCHFQVYDSVAVRYVVDNNKGALSVDDGLAIPCVREPLGAAEAGGQGEADALADAVQRGEN